MKPGRIAYWLAINNNFIKTTVHYFLFIVFPVLYVLHYSKSWYRFAVFLSLLSYEVSTQFKNHHVFLKSSWLTILLPLIFLISIPTIIVLYRFCKAIYHFQSYPRHIFYSQCGRVLFCFGFCLSFSLHFLIAMGSTLHPLFAIFPVVTLWFFSSPLLISRIYALDVFVKQWHNQLSDQNQSRLLLWKANWFKAQIIGELLLSFLLTSMFLSIHILCFYHLSRRTFIHFQF